jgi:hypothetical protein
MLATRALIRKNPVNLISDRLAPRRLSPGAPLTIDCDSQRVDP